MHLGCSYKAFSSLPDIGPPVGHIISDKSQQERDCLACVSRKLVGTYLAARGKSRAGAKNGDCHQFAPRHDPRNKALSLKRIGWLYPIFRDLHFYHGLLGY